MLDSLDARSKLSLPNDLVSDGALKLKDALDYATTDSAVKKFDRLEGGRGSKQKPDLATTLFSAIRDQTGRENLKKTDRGLVVKGVGRKTVTPGNAKTAPGKKPAKKSVPRQRAFGEPTLKQFTKAASNNKLRVTKKGKLATVAQLKAAGQLKGSRQQFAQAKKQAKGAPRRALMEAGLDPEQAKVLNTVLKTGKKAGASKKEMLAAVETAIVESNIANLGGGDADSAGWRQERAMYYPNPTNVKASAARYFDETASQGRGAGMTAGQLAQSVQRSAYPDKYDAVKGDAAPLLKAFTQAPARAVPKQVKRDLRRSNEQAFKLGVPGAKDPEVPQKQIEDVGATTLAKAPPKTVSRFKAMMSAANDLENAQLPYNYGGGHVTPAEPTGGQDGSFLGLDCSSAVSYVLQHGGVDMPTIVSGDFGSVTKPGEGAVTILYNPGHVLMKIGNKYFGTSSTNPEGGAGFIDKSLGDSELASGKYSIGHVPGMGQKIANAMGIKVGGSNSSSGSFPGMTNNGDGTVSVNPGAGVTLGSPGYSSKPIVSDRAASAGAGAYAGGIASALPQAYTDLILGNGTTTESDILSEFIGDRAKPRKRR